MRTIVHLSDLHFCKVDDRIIAPLVQRVRSINPDLIAVSGDFTQRARRRQFTAARAFLDALPFPRLVVPGNHDVPLFNVAARVFNPFGAYQRHIAEELEPMMVDQEMAVVGLNSARAFITGGRGRLNDEQVARAESRLRPLPPHLIKIIVTHHPFDLPDGVDDVHLVGRARMAMSRLAAVGADLFLAGHLHVSHVSRSADRYQIEGHSALVVQAGTMSTRSRGEVNTFNVLRIARPDLTVERYTWSDAGTFTRSWTRQFRHTEQGWTA